METETTPAKLDAPLLVEREGGRLHLTLNRPQVFNALTHAMLGGLLGELRKAERDRDIRVVVLTGAGQAFCSGMDLAELKKSYESGRAPSYRDELSRHFNPLIRQIRRMEKPVLAAVNGVAAGAGASLALACDLKLCAASAKFISAFISVGLAPDSGFTFALARGLGLSLGLEHAWTGKPIPARQAEEFGLVNRVVPADELKAAVRDLVDKLLAAPPRAVALTKRALNRALGAEFEATLEYEAHLQEILGRSKDHIEGMNAFLEKRPPKFTGE